MHQDQRTHAAHLYLIAVFYGELLTLTTPCRMQDEYGSMKLEDISKKEKKASVSWILVWTVSAVAIGSGFQHGYNLAVINTSGKVIKSWLKETMELNEGSLTIVWSSVVSILCIGGVVGSAFTGVFTSKFGRRLVLITNNVIAIAACLLMGLSKYANQPWMILFGRFLIGVHTGVSSVAANMYTSEISPMKIRGAIGATYQVLMTISILFATIVGSEQCLGNAILWPILLLLPIIPAVYQFIALLASPESPKYLLEIGDESKAISETIRFYGEEEGRDLITQIKNELVDKSSEPMTIMTMLTTPQYRRPLVIVCILMAAQQWTGMNDITYYSTDIFETAGFSEEASQRATIIFGVVIMISSVAALFMVDRFGRKFLLVAGFGCLAVNLIVLTICLYCRHSSSAVGYAIVVLISLMVILYQLGPGTVRWIIGSELFTTRARSIGLSIGTAVNWFANFVIGIAYPPLYEMMGPGVFIIFVVVCLLSAVYSYARIPETKNKPIDEITAQFE